MDQKSINKESLEFYKRLFSKFCLLFVPNSKKRKPTLIIELKIILGKLDLMLEWNAWSFLLVQLGRSWCPVSNFVQVWLICKTKKWFFLSIQFVKFLIELSELLKFKVLFEFLCIHYHRKGQKQKIFDHNEIFFSNLI